jgi:hypothetical protein
LEKWNRSNYAGEMVFWTPATANGKICDGAPAKMVARPAPAAAPSTEGPSYSTTGNPCRTVSNRNLLLWALMGADALSSAVITPKGKRIA